MSQSLCEVRQVQAVAMSNDEKDEDEEDEKEEKKQAERGQSAAQWEPLCGVSRNLEDTRKHVFPSTVFFACSHICCLGISTFCFKSAHFYLQM